MRALIFLVACICACYAAEPRAAEGPKVTTSLGTVEGSILTSRLGRVIYTFRGMRYAEAPSGELRFKVAVPAKSWSGVFDASKESPSCPRTAGKFRIEDCLRVNVYTTKLPANASVANVTDGTKKPVLVFFHPGGFHGYSGQSYIFGPQYLLDQDIVLVTINYRIGALGFLATGDAVAPGNLGLKDQVEALRWVRNNIAAFGGDPNCVTISGYSAGSWSVVLHMVSPMSKGLFHRAIAMSGSPTKGPPLPRDLIGYSKKQARLLNCPDDTSEKIVQCLKTKTADEMAATRPQFYEWQFDPLRVWTPVIEPDIPGLERFIVDQPNKLIKEGKFHQVPLMAGVTRDEFGSLTIQEIVQARQGNDSIFRDLDANWSRIAPISFSYERDTPKSRRISQGLRDFYFQGKPISLKTVQGHADCYSDALVGSAIHRLVHLVAPVSKQPVYYYRFVYQGRYSHAKWPDTSEPYDNKQSESRCYGGGTKWAVLFMVDGGRLTGIQVETKRRASDYLLRIMDMGIHLVSYAISATKMSQTLGSIGAAFLALGVVHHDDLLYLFYISLYPYFEKDAPEIPTVEMMTAMWGNFVKSGEPIPKSNERFAGVTWDRFTTENEKYMEINKTLSMKTNLHSERMQLYDRLFPVIPEPDSPKPSAR